MINKLVEAFIPRSLDNASRNRAMLLWPFAGDGTLLRV